MSTRIVEIRAGVLKQNDEIARALRRTFEASGTLVANLVSSPGSGKTTLLQQTLDVAVITKSDLAEACEFDRTVAFRAVRDVRPAMPILELSAKPGVGMAHWIEELEARRELWLRAHRTREAEVPGT